MMDGAMESPMDDGVLIDFYKGSKSIDIQLYA